MKYIHTLLEGCFLMMPSIFEDGRGYFLESFNEKGFNEHTGTITHFIQDNQSYSTYGVIRGLHFQKGEYAQAKLVKVLSGKVLDAVVDLREESPTYGQHFSVVLSAENKQQLFIPRGCAHGFSVLSETAEFYYKCDNYYNKNSEGGILYNDASLNIDWKIPSSEIKISAKDRLLPPFFQLQKQLQ